MLAWSQVEVILDHICYNAICFTVEHYYHQLLKKNHLYAINRHYEKLKHEYETVYKHKIPLFNKEEFYESKTQFEHQIERTEEARAAVGYELRSFAQFIKKIYGDTEIKLF